MKTMKSISSAVVVIAIVGFAGLAFAHGGGGYGYGMMGPGMMGDGYGYYGPMGPGMMGYGYGGYGMMGPDNGYGYGYGMRDQGRYYRNDRGDEGYGRLSQKQAEQLEQARESFYDNTRQLRNEIRDNQITLNQELDKANPDAARVTQLQKTISELRSKYDQKALAYELEAHKIAPEVAGNRDDFGPGYGYCTW